MYLRYGCICPYCDIYVGDDHSNLSSVYSSIFLPAAKLCLGPQLSGFSGDLRFQVFLFCFANTCTLIIRDTSQPRGRDRTWLSGVNTTAWVQAWQPSMTLHLSCPGIVPREHFHRFLRSRDETFHEWRRGCAPGPHCGCGDH